MTVYSNNGNQCDGSSLTRHIVPNDEPPLIQHASVNNSGCRNKRRNPYADSIVSTRGNRRNSVQTPPSHHQLQQQHPHRHDITADMDTEVNHPSINLQEDATSICLSMDLAGVLAKDVQVNVQRGVLSIRGIRSHRSVHDGRVNKRQRFSRRFAVDTDIIDITRARANLVNGVLVLYAPKKAKLYSKFSIPVTEMPESDFFANCNPASYSFSVGTGASHHQRR